MTYKIYGHKSPANKWYIGRTGQKLEKRWQNGVGYKSCPKFYAAIQKYGWDKFEHVFIAECETEEQSILVEAMFKRIYDSVDNGYNCSKELESTGFLGQHHKEESKAKNRQAHLGKSPYNKGLVKEKQPNYGKGKLSMFKNEIIEKYKTGNYTHLQLSIEYNCKKSSISNLLKNNNIKAIKHKVSVETKYKKSLWAKKRKFERDNNGKFVKEIK